MNQAVANASLRFVQSFTYGLDRCTEYFIYHNIKFIEDADCDDIDIQRIKEKYGLQ